MTYVHDRTRTYQISYQYKALDAQPYTTLKYLNKIQHHGNSVVSVSMC